MRIIERDIVAGVAIVTAVIVLLLALAAFWLGVRYLFAEWQGRVDAEVQIESAGSRIARYEHFFSLCASAQSNEVTIDRLRAQLESEGLEPRERTRLETTLTGVIAARADAVSKYNAESTQSYTSAQFRDSDLPYQLPLTYEGVPTQCALR
jgi:hypothetical protein